MGINTTYHSELVFGIVGPVGANTKKVIEFLKERLTNNFDYDVKDVNISHIISETLPIQKDRKKRISEFERLNNLMNVGNILRQKLDPAILAMAAADHIETLRIDSQNDKKEPAPCEKKAYIIKSLKNPAEVELLRAVYSVGFYLIGVFEGEEERRENLKIKQPNISTDELDMIIERDQEEKNKHGQQSRATYQLADFFVDLTERKDTKIKANIDRFLDLIFGEPFMTPTFGEYAMFIAYCTSIRSADISRQIGAVICKNDEILSAGANDCPKVDGGLYWIHYNPDAEKADDCYKDEDGGRDHTLGVDANKEQFKRIVESIFHELKSKLKEEVKIELNEDSFQIMRNTLLGDLTEYGRAVHAEMEALACCARNNVSCRDAEMYVTTFPCHNCAKHLIAAGIKKIVYIEAYPKSKTDDFYGYLIDKRTREKTNEQNSSRIKLIPFFGVGPRRFVDLFAINAMNANYILPRKRRADESSTLAHYGKAEKWNNDKAQVRSILDPISYLEKEVKYSKLFYDYLGSEKFSQLLQDLNKGETNYG